MRSWAMTTWTRLAQLEGVAWPMLQQRPANLLPPAFDSWDALLIDAARRTESELAKQGPLAKRTWGERNTAAICHPIARALPDIAKRWLCMPADRLPGDRDMPRVQTPNFGASERMVVSPGHEADGIVHARRPERPSTVTVLGRRPRGLGAWTADAVPARQGAARDDAGAGAVVPAAGRHQVSAS
jgi:penicillin amidase